MGTQFTSSLYEKYAGNPAENYERHFVPSIGEPFALRLLASAAPVPGERVLDVACGTGVATRLASEAVGPEGETTGLDAHPGMLEVARAVSPDGIEWKEAPAENMPFPDGSFDLVLCSMGLQFFADKVSALREMRRVLVPGGRAAVLTPGPTPPLMEAFAGALTQHVAPEAAMFVHAVFSVHDPDEARGLLDQAGFDAVVIERGSVPLRLAPPADFFWQYIRSTPLADVVGNLDDAARADLERDVVQRSRPFVDGDVTLLEPKWLIAKGRATG